MTPPAAPPLPPVAVDVLLGEVAVESRLLTEETREETLETTEDKREERLELTSMEVLEETSEEEAERRVKSACVMF